LRDKGTCLGDKGTFVLEIQIVVRQASTCLTKKGLSDAAGDDRAVPQVR
jgi:hypothetical protein